MKKSNILFIALSIVLFYFSNSSCNRTNFSEQIVAVDSLHNQVDSYLFQLNSIDSTEVMSYYPIVKKDIAWVSDSLAREDLKNSSVFLSKLKTANKLMQVFPQEYSTLKKELTISLYQLEDLKSDLENNTINEVEANRYVNDEKLALKNIGNHEKKLMQKLDSMKDYIEIRKDFYLMVGQQGN